MISLIFSSGWGTSSQRHASIHKEVLFMQRRYLIYFDVLTIILCVWCTISAFRELRMQFPPFAEAPVDQTVNRRTPPVRLNNIPTPPPSPVTSSKTFALGPTSFAAQLTPERIKLQKILDSPNSRQELIDWFNQGDLVEQLYCMTGFYICFPEEWDERRYLPIWENQRVHVMVGCMLTINMAENILAGIELGETFPEHYNAF
ncbi:MAG: hypothetical protein SFY68_04520 [Candidatus Sumerlaeia bacterium]|nr:hypothetical protein [Candidatus Sumerlaeia bacterium]